MLANYQVRIWWIDQITAYIGLIICTILCIITIKTIRSHDLPFRLRSLIYIVHISSVSYFISAILAFTILPFLNAIRISVNQSTICFITYASLSTTGAVFLLSVVNLFFERLYLSFHGTDLGMSRRFTILFRVIVCTIWVSLGFTYLFVSDPTPYNIYHQRIAIHSTDGITCSTHTKGVDDTMTIVYELIAAMISITNLLIWALFIFKLYTLLQQTTANNVSDVSADFLWIMKHQTMLVGIAVFSSIILWTLEATFQIGHIFASIDFIVTTFVCFLTFTFNEKYFIWFKCDVLTRLCCKWFESVISVRSGIVVELKLAADFKRGIAECTDDAKNKVSSQSTETAVKSVSEAVSISVDVVLDA